MFKEGTAEKLHERGADYKVLFAFSDVLHPATGKSITEHQVNGLREGEAIEDRFQGGDYRLMVVANKFQTGFDQPLLTGMFIDKVVMDRDDKGRFNELADPKYTDIGAIFDIMAVTVIQHHQQGAAF